MEGEIDSDPVAQEAAQLFAASEGETPADEEALAQAQGTGEEEEAAKSGPDWEAEDNPYRAKYTGLEGNFKQLHAERQAMMQRMGQLEADLEVQKAVASGASDEEVNQIRNNWADQEHLAHFLSDLAQENARIGAARAALQPLAREMTLRDIGKEYGIDPKELEDAETPQAAISMAKMLQRQTKHKVLEGRKSAGIDRMESGRGGGVNIQKLSPIQKIRLGVEQAARR